MSWIRTIPEAEATGLLARIYAESRRRAGQVHHIVRVMSQGPKVAEASLELYKRVQFGKGTLSRARREMLAVVVSRANDCHY